MKRVFQHPPAPTSGRRYWRSTDELADTPEFREWLEREFPSSAAQLNGDEWSRRNFLKLMGASVALAGFGVSSCRRPEMHLVPFTKTGTAPAWRFWLKKRIRPRGKEFAANWKKCSRGCTGAFTIRCGARRKISPPKSVSETICASFPGSSAPT